MDSNNLQISGLKCSCVIEKVSESGQVLHKEICKSAILDLGRNEVEDVVLKLSTAKSDAAHGPFTIRKHSIHRKFLNEGKASIRLETQRLNILISNSPPDHLRTFLQTLSIKLAARGKIQGSHRRMLGDISTKFNEISPLNDKDMDKANLSLRKEGAGSKLSSGKENTTLTPHRREKTSTLRSRKRKLIEMTSTGSNASEESAPLAKKPVLLKSCGVPLSPEQAKVLQLVKTGESVFFTGSAGSGKSYLLKRIVSAMPPETTFTTASTGAAACLVGGTTLHSFAGIGFGNGTLKHCVAMASREPHASVWKKCRCLIIDEISMIDAELFDKIEAVAREVRNSKRVFGGIQLVLCGDFFQLPPISKESEKKRFCFQAECWNTCISRTIELTQVHRQKEKKFIALLQNIRIGRCPPAICDILTSTQNQDIEREGLRATKLCTHKEDVNAINCRELEALGGAQHKFEAQDSHPHMVGFLNTMCPVGETVMLKVGAQVMLTKNTDIHRGLVNGARGVIKKFDPINGFPVVWFASGQEEVVGRERWNVRGGGGVIVTRKQLPLKLAWAISIHKSQGMTLDCVEMSLGRCFEAGQAYVALSRAKSLQSLRVRDFHPSCIRADSDVLDFYRALRQTRRNYIDE